LVLLALFVFYHIIAPMELLVFGEAFHVNHPIYCMRRRLKMAVKIKNYLHKKSCLCEAAFLLGSLINYKPELIPFSLSVNSLATASCWFI
jgi:hypothetical protein